MIGAVACRALGCRQEAAEEDGWKKKALVRVGERVHCNSRFAVDSGPKEGVQQRVGSGISRFKPKAIHCFGPRRGIPGLRHAGTTRRGKILCKL